MATEFDTTAVKSLLSPLASSLDRDGLESLIQYRATPQVQDWMDELAERGNAGTLSPAEEREFDTLVETSRMLAILKAEAKKILESQDAA